MIDKIGFDSAAPQAVRVQFSNVLDRATLVALHAAPSVEQIPEQLRHLFQVAGVLRIKEVYSVSPEEIDRDAYAFAREFVCYLSPGRDTDAAVAALQQSPLVERASPEALRKAW